MKFCRSGSGRLLRRRADRGRVIADVVIPGQMPARHLQRIVQLFREDEIVAAGRRVEGEVAAVDDEVGPCRIDMRGDAVKIVGELWQAAGEMGVRNLRQAK